jgi:hypothetical protein
LPAAGKGDIILDLYLPNGSTQSGSLHNVLHVPELAKNLFSISTALKNGYQVIISETKCNFIDNSRNTQVNTTN